MFINNLGKHKQYRDLEKSLQKKFKVKRENEAALGKEDFKGGKLTVQGFENLKQQCDYIPFSGDIEIKIPKECEDGFQKSLNSMGAIELSRIKKDRREAMIASAILLLVGIGLVLFGNFIEFHKVPIFENIVIIASWVFVWAAVEKWFFDRRKLSDKRFSLLQILSAKITAQ